MSTDDIEFQHLQDIPLIERARILMDRGEHERAVGCLREALRSDSEDIDAWLKLSTALQEAGEPAEAMDACEKAYELIPEDDKEEIDPLVQKLWLFSEQGATEKVASLVDEALLAIGRSSEKWYRLGSWLYEFEEYAQAIRLYDRALCADPDYFDAMDGKIEALRAAGRLTELWIYLDNLIARYPRDATVRFERGRLMYEFELYSEAEENLWFAVNFDPESIEAQHYHALALWRLGNAEQAQALLRETAREADYDYELWSDLGLITMETDKTARKVEAFFYLNKALRMCPHSVKVLSNKARALHLMGRDEEANDLKARIVKQAHEQQEGFP